MNTREIKNYKIFFSVDPKSVEILSRKNLNYWNFCRFHLEGVPIEEFEFECNYKYRPDKIFNPKRIFFQQKTISVLLPKMHTTTHTMPITVRFPYGPNMKLVHCAPRRYAVLGLCDRTNVSAYHPPFYWYGTAIKCSISRNGNKLWPQRQIPQCDIIGT